MTKVVLRKNNQMVMCTLLIIFFSLFSIAPRITGQPVWDEEWSFVEQIEIPIDTSLPAAKYQPIDFRITFKSTCWAKNEDHHSIRICCWDGTDWHELESQIYDLKHSDENHVSACSIVFLIPSFADGTEQYYVYYDDSETAPPKYPTHITYDESSYYYEPISGYPLVSDYYEIRDDDLISYMISYEGKFMGYNTCQHVYKMLEGTTKLVPKNAELFTGFDIKYCYDDGLFDYSSTSQKLVSKDVFTAGNLMIEIGIVSTSKFDDLRTTATYKYYHCPTSTKRMHVHVTHEALESIDIYSETNTDGTYATLQAGGVKSRSIEELNIGEILPHLHFMNEMNSLTSYKIDTDPEYIKDDPDIRIISVDDDVDLGDTAWVSFNEGDKGKAHGLLFDSNEVVQSDLGETDGLQINVFEMDYPHLAGLENNIATVQVGRNSVEPNMDQDLTIPKGFTVEFDAAFFSSPDGGYNAVQKEYQLFQKMVQLKPTTTADIEEEVEDEPQYDLTVYVHNERAFPFGSSLSAALGLNFSYLTVELYKQNNFAYSQNAVHVPLNALADLKDPTLIEQIKATLNIIDYRNISLFKKAVFSDLTKGTYVVKVYKEHPLFSTERAFIGYGVFEVNEDQRVHIWCRKETTLGLTVADQNNEKIPGADIYLQFNNQTIASAVTDEEGKAMITAPFQNKNYLLSINYNDITVYQEMVGLPFLPRLNSLDKSITLNRYDVQVTVTDTWGQIPFVDLHPTLLLEENNVSSPLQPVKTSDGYVFTNLTENKYRIQLSFKSFRVEESFQLSDDIAIDLEFPAEFPISFGIRDIRGNKLPETTLLIQRNTKEERLSLDSADTTVSLPPGKYLIEVFNQNDCIGKQTVEFYGGKKVHVITHEQPLYPLLATILCVLLILIAGVYLFIKKKTDYILLIVVIGLLLLSLFLPWWELEGDSSDFETSTQLFFIPQNMITTYQSDESMTGETAYLPDEIMLLISAIITATISSSVLILIAMFVKEKTQVKKTYQKLFPLLIIVLLFACVVGFLFAMNEVSRISVGSVFGSGEVEFGIPGESELYQIDCSWGPSLGFYFFVIGTIVFCGQIIYNIVLRLRKRNESE